MDVPLVLVVLGGILVILGLAGGGIKTKWVEVPAQIGRGVRIASALFGFLCVLSGGALYVYESSLTAKGSGEGERPPLRAPPPQVHIRGEVADIFGNPRGDVVVIVRGVQCYALSDEKGRFYLPEVPLEPSVTLEAYYGVERDSITLSAGEEDAGRQIQATEHLILNPIEVEAVLCRYVESVEGEGLKPFEIYEGENPRIALGSLFRSGGQNAETGTERLGEIFCFLKIIGPYRYEVGKETELTFEWYLDGEIQGKPYRQEVGVRPFGWRTRASKKVWPGQWILKVRAKHGELSRIPFEIYE